MQLKIFTVHSHILHSIVDFYFFLNAVTVTVCDTDILLETSILLVQIQCCWYRFTTSITRVHCITYFVKTFDAVWKSVGLGLEKKSWFWSWKRSSRFWSRERSLGLKKVLFTSLDNSQKGCQMLSSCPFVAILNFFRAVSCHLTFRLFTSTLFNSSYLAILPSL